MEKLSERMLNQRLEKLESWDLISGSIQRTYKFRHFKEAFAMMTVIAFECEKQDHHPDWCNVYDSLTIRLTTHDAGGVTEKDFRLAHAIEKIVLHE